MNATAARLGLGGWLERYKASHQQLLDADPDFARWLEEEYLPIAGGWMY
jgi:hypothetical protein